MIVIVVIVIVVIVIVTGGKQSQLLAFSFRLRLRLEFDKNLLPPQIWGISAVLKIAIAPDLGKFPRSGCHLTGAR